MVQCPRTILYNIFVVSTIETERSASAAFVSFSEYNFCVLIFNAMYTSEYLGLSVIKYI